MAFTHITNEDREGKGNVGQPDTPLLTTTEMQEQMDSLPNLAIDKFNSFLDELEADTAAQSIGCTAPTGITVSTNTLYAVINAIARLAIDAEGLSHTHANTEAIDLFTCELVESLSYISTMLSGITGIASSITDSNEEIPTSKVVKDYIETANISTSILNSIYPVGAVYMTATTDPDTIFGTSGKWTLIGTSSDGIKTYKRTA